MHSLTICVAIFFPLLFGSSLFSAPSVTSVSPFYGPIAGGNIVTIKGSGFTGAVGVIFGNKTSNSFTALDDNTLQAVVPVNSFGVVDIQVVTLADGTTPINRPGDYYTYQGDWIAYVPDFNSQNAYPIDVQTQVIGIPITVGSNPNDVSFTPDGKTAAVACSGAGTIVNIDVATESVASTIPLTNISFPILGVSPFGGSIIVAGYSSNNVGIYDLKYINPPVIVPVGENPTSVAIIPNGILAYVTNSGTSAGPTPYVSPSITQINLLTFETVTKVFAGKTPTFIAITPDGRKAVVTDDANNEVFFFDPMTFEEVGTPISGFSLQQPNYYPQIAITADETSAWVTNTSSNTITSINGLDTSNPTLGTTYEVNTINPSIPNGIALTADGLQAYVSNGAGGANSLSIVNLSDGVYVEKMVGNTPTDPAITPDQAPVAYFSTSRGYLVGEEVLFDASASLSPVGTIASYQWNFGDGSPHVMTTSPTITHTYKRSGTYQVSLEVTNTAGTSTVQKYSGQVMLANGGPSAELTQTIAVDPTASPHFTGHQCKNQFVTQTEYVNILQWSSSKDPAVVKYLLYRNGVLIAKIPRSKPLKYTDHDQPKDNVTTYTLIAVDASGLKSSPKTVTLP
jgi:DNA-binding beta-propeller fold protein YncE